MKIVLKPISHPAMDTIAIDDSRITIGRILESFKSLKDTAGSRLSRRHARIFKDEGELYIVDLGSLNGTQVNGQPVEEEAIRLLNGDQINFAGDILFRVEMENEPGDERTLVIQPPPQLVLAPQETDGGIEPIRVSRFPFLITRSYTLFGQYMEHAMEDVRKISRPHAIIGLIDNEIYIEDLESANGTYIAGKKLEADQKVIADGATIAFGGNRFTYKVKLEQAERTEYDPACAPVAESVESPDETTDYSHTIVNSSQSFLDSISEEYGTKNAVDPDPDRLIVSTRDPVEKPGSPEKKRRKPHSGLKQVLGRLSGNHPKIIGTWVGVYALAFVMVATAHIHDSGKRNIKENPDNRVNFASVIAASEHLDSQQVDGNVNAWAMESLIKAVVPDWIEYAKQGRFDDAETYLTTVKQRYPSVESGQEMIDLLVWAGRVENHFYERAGEDNTILMFRHEELIRELVEEWNRDPFKHQLLFNQVVDFVPSFEEHHARVIRELQALQSDSRRLKEKMQVQLKDSFDRINKQWTAYQDAGGIPGVVLVEGRVSKRFRRQAERLSAAYRDIIDVERKYDLIRIEGSTDWRQLKEEVVHETMRQSRWLKDLYDILEPNLLTAKLDLLPEIME